MIYDMIYFGLSKLIQNYENSKLIFVKIHKKMKLPQKGTQYTCGKNDLFSVVIAFRMLLSTEDFSQFKKSFNLIIKQYIKNTENISQKTFLQTMGLPENWNHISKYKL